MISRSLKYTLATAILLAVMLVATVVPVATAKTDTAAKPVDGAAIDRMIEKLEPFVARCDDGTFRLDIPADAKINRNGAEFRTVSAGMEAINSLIQEGILVTTPDLSVYSANDSRFALQSNNRTEFKPRWYGFELWLDHNICDTLQSCGNIAAIAAALCAAIPTVPTLLAAAIAAYLGIGAEILGILDNGCGVHFKFYVNGMYVVPFHAAGQTCK